uniref:ATP synthase complex subunit 8 n=1 Tax=Astrospartus mediterraneus TaxID=691888 RepID=D3H5Y0_ASTMD|nr:ATP synthase F0 subunit 8 [Astrospartus mediterraneus]CBH40154.1 ATPase subunit 8 [Astrospartus mediterraneus]
MPQLEFSLWLFNLTTNWSLIIIIFIWLNFSSQNNINLPQNNLTNNNNNNTWNW